MGRCTKQTANVLPDGLDHCRPGPSGAAMLVGAQLRRLPEACGIMGVDAGEAIRASDYKINGWSWGRTGFKRRVVTDLPTLYGVHDETERQAFLALAARAYAPGLWYADPRGDLKGAQPPAPSAATEAPPCASRAGGGGQGCISGTAAGWRDQGRSSDSLAASRGVEPLAAVTRRRARRR